MKRLTLIAVIVPLVGLLALMGRAEFAVRSGPTWQIPISGYDPRDLLHGRFLRYRYELNWQGADSCGPGAEDSRRLDPDCCLCLTRTNRHGINPPVHQVQCDEVHACDGWLQSSALEGGQRYFVPEDRATELENALRDRDASLELTCGPGGNPAISDLLLDGQPWRKILAD